MAFELNIRAAPVDPSHEDYEVRYESAFYKPGDIISVKRFGWSSNPTWADSAYNFVGTNKDSGYFICVVCTDGPTHDQVTNVLDKPWNDNFVYTITASYPEQGKYTVEVINENVSTTGKASLNRDKIESWLIGWGCENISFLPNKVIFDFLLWNAVQSWKFWETQGIATLVNFSLISYSVQTGIGRIGVEVINQNVTMQKIVFGIKENGGTIITNNHPNYVFEIEKSIVLAKFKKNVLQAQKVYRRRRYRFLNTLVNEVANNGGRKEYTYAQLQAVLQDGLSE